MLFTQGMLTGREIERQVKKGHITISPYDPKCINPNSYNLKLHPQLLIYARNAELANLLPHKKAKIATKDDYEDKKEFEPTVTKNNSDTPTGMAVISAIDLLEDKLNKTEEALGREIELRCDQYYNIPIINSAYMEPLDMNKKNETIEFEIPEEGYVLQPGVLYIGRTVEKTGTDKFIPMINGRSSGGRLGISIHITAGFGDIGFDGTWTLEITVVEPVRIYPNAEIAQVCYFTPAGRKAKLYRGRYYNQEEATASRFYQPKKEY